MQETHALTPFLFPPSVGRVQSLRIKKFSESEFQKCSHRVFAEEIEMEAPISVVESVFWLFWWNSDFELSYDLRNLQSDCWFVLVANEKVAMRRGWCMKDSIAFVCVMVTVCSLMVVIVTMLRLPEVSTRQNSAIREGFNDESIGKFGEMMLEMLPQDLAFTIFVPSEKAFQRDLRLQVNRSLAAEQMNDTYAVLSRVLGFSAVPRPLYSKTMLFGKEMCFDSLSGFELCIWKESDGAIIVNRVRSARMDMRKGEIVVHIMDGVIMDFEFEQSFQLDYSEEEEHWAELSSLDVRHIPPLYLSLHSSCYSLLLFHLPGTENHNPNLNSIRWDEWCRFCGNIKIDTLNEN